MNGGRTRTQEPEPFMMCQKSGLKKSFLCVLTQTKHVSADLNYPTE